MGLAPALGRALHSPAAQLPHSEVPHSPIPGLTVCGERMKILVWPNASSSGGNASSASSTSAPSLHHGKRRGWSEPLQTLGQGAARHVHGLAQPRTCHCRPSGARSGG